MTNISTVSEVARTGIGLGTVIAVVISWDRNKSILWAIFHGFISWFYVIYYALTDRQHHTGRAIAYTILAIIAVHLIIVLFVFASQNLHI